MKKQQQLLRNFLENLAGIANRSYQRRVWIEGRGPECDDFTEAVCDFFDLGDPIFNNQEYYKISERQYKLLINFRDKFRAFSNEHDIPEEFIDTPEWERIMKMASAVLKAFNYQQKN